MATFRFDMDCTGWSQWYEIDAVKLISTVVAQHEKPKPKTLAADLLTMLDSHTGDVAFQTLDGDVIRAHSMLILARAPHLLMARAEPIVVHEHTVVLRHLLEYIYSSRSPSCGLPVSPSWSATHLFSLLQVSIFQHLNCPSWWSVLVLRWRRSSEMCCCL